MTAKALGHRSRCVIVCSEAVWWRSHRRIITDYPLCCGATERHTMDTRHITTAMMTPGAQPQVDNTLIYQAQAEP
jgi:uncharacterized protein (DUF488 family)